MIETRQLYPPIEPYRTGRLDVGDGHALHWELCGNPAGRPVVFLHGGPGSGCGPNHRRLFDPERYQILLFDQRGCGRSTPTGALEANTTWHLVADLERLRAMLDVPEWMLFGGSWGATLALAYAQAHPGRVSALVLRGVFSGRRAEVDWFYGRGASLLFPDHWADFVEPIPPEERGDLVAAYRRRLTHAEPEVRGAAAAAWTAWEARTVAVRGGGRRIAAAPGGRRVLAHPGPLTVALARIENHYFAHDCWLADGQLLADAGRLAGIPGVIIQGRYDVVTPAATAHALHKAWPSSRWQVVDGAGHAFTEPGTLAALIEATDRFAQAPVLSEA